MSNQNTKESKENFHLIVSDDTSPTVRLAPGMRFEVRAVTIVDAELKQAGPVAARLCGGTTTCLALIEI